MCILFVTVLGGRKRSSQQSGSGAACLSLVGARDTLIFIPFYKEHAQRITPFISANQFAEHLLFEGRRYAEGEVRPVPSKASKTDHQQTAQKQQLAQWWASGRWSLVAGRWSLVAYCDCTSIARSRQVLSSSARSDPRTSTGAEAVNKVG
jgi:hypothetical protein